MVADLASAPVVGQALAFARPDQRALLYEARGLRVVHDVAAGMVREYDGRGDDVEHRARPAWEVLPAAPESRWTRRNLVDHAPGKSELRGFDYVE